MVFDIDETALSNWEGLKANDFGRIFTGPCDRLPQGPCGLIAWDQRAQSTVTPSITPTTEINVMIERNVRFGFKYRSAKKRLKGSFNSSLAWRQTQPDSNAASPHSFVRPDLWRAPSVPPM